MWAAANGLGGKSLAAGQIEFALRRDRQKLLVPVADAVLRGPASDDLRVTWLGHSTVLLEIGGARLHGRWHLYRGQSRTARVKS